MRKRIALAVLGAGLAVGVASFVNAQKAMPEVSIILNWFAEPPHGGYYAAVQDGLYEKAGVKVKLIPGGPNVAASFGLASCSEWTGVPLKVILKRPA